MMIWLETTPSKQMLAIWMLKSLTLKLQERFGVHSMWISRAISTDASRTGILAAKGCNGKSDGRFDAFTKPYCFSRSVCTSFKTMQVCKIFLQIQNSLCVRLLLKRGKHCVYQFESDLWDPRLSIIVLLQKVFWCDSKCEAVSHLRSFKKRIFLTISTPIIR